MERILTNILLLFFAISFNAMALNIPASTNTANSGYGKDTATAANTVSAGNRNSRITLFATSTNTTVNNYYRLVKMGAQTTSQENYQVTGGKTLVCDGFYMRTATTNVSVGFLYGTAAVTNDNAAAPAGEKLFYGGTTGFEIPQDSLHTWITVPMSFPASSFPAIKVTNGAAGIFHITLLCAEE